MRTLRPGERVCTMVTTGFDSRGLPDLAVDCPNRPVMPGVETCLGCDAFVKLTASPGGSAVGVVCTPATVREKVRAELGLADEAPAHADVLPTPPPAEPDEKTSSEG